MKMQAQDRALREYHAKLEALERTEDRCHREIKRQEAGLDDLYWILGRFSLFDSGILPGCELGDFAYIEGEQSHLLDKVHRNSEDQINDLRAEIRCAQQQADEYHGEYLRKLRELDAQEDGGTSW